MFVRMSEYQGNTEEQAVSQIVLSVLTMQFLICYASDKKFMTGDRTILFFLSLNNMFTDMRNR